MVRQLHFETHWACTFNSQVWHYQCGLTHKPNLKCFAKHFQQHKLDTPPFPCSTTSPPFWSHCRKFNESVELLGPFPPSTVTSCPSILLLSQLSHYYSTMGSHGPSVAGERHSDGLPSALETAPHYAPTVEGQRSLSKAGSMQQEAFVSQSGSKPGLNFKGKRHRERIFALRYNANRGKPMLWISLTGLLPEIFTSRTVYFQCCEGGLGVKEGKEIKDIQCVQCQTLKSLIKGTLFSGIRT